jgi:hypothetical protein
MVSFGVLLVTRQKGSRAATMHATDILQKCFVDVFTRMHAARVRVLAGAVMALVSGRRLVLMDLARAWPGAERVRAPLKKLDRLLSNQHLQGERVWLYEQIARWCVRCPEPLIVVDWSTLKSDESYHLLRAALATKGRTLTLYEEVHPQKRAQSPKVHRAFLKQLHQRLPAQCRPILLTDAGFRCPWFTEVEALGWRWVGRVRNQVGVKLGENSLWQALGTLMDGGAKLQCFGAAYLVRAKPFACQLLRYRAEIHGRKHRNSRGQVSRSKQSRASARAHREPWVLAFCNDLQGVAPMRIVKLYEKRMRIEQGFRDLKSVRYGCAFRLSLTRKPARIAVLLLLHALASFVAWLQGVMVKSLQKTTHCEIRCKSERARYSSVRIGWESLRRNQSPPPMLDDFTLTHVPPWLTTALGIET